MPKTKSPKHAGKNRHDPLHAQLKEDETFSKYGKVSQPGRRSKQQTRRLEEEDEVCYIHFSGSILTQILRSYLTRRLPNGSLSWLKTNKMNSRVSLMTMKRLKMDYQDLATTWTIWTMTKKKNCLKEAWTKRNTLNLYVISRPFISHVFNNRVLIANRRGRYEDVGRASSFKCRRAADIGRYHFF